MVNQSAQTVERELLKNEPQQLQSVKVSVSGNFFPPAVPSDISQEKLNFIANFYPYAVMASAMTGLPVSFIMGQAVHESGWGKHAPGHNYFGMKWAPIDRENPNVTGSMLLRTLEYKTVNGKKVPYHTLAKFAKFNNEWGCVISYALYLHRKYPDVFTKDATSSLEAFAEYIKKGGYATDPKYVHRIIASTREIQEYLKKMHLKDFNFGYQNPLVSISDATNYLSQLGYTVNVDGPSSVLYKLSNPSTSVATATPDSFIQTAQELISNAEKVCTADTGITLNSQQQQISQNEQRSEQNELSENPVVRFLDSFWKQIKSQPKYEQNLNAKNQSQNQNLVATAIQPDNYTEQPAGGISINF